MQVSPRYHVGGGWVPRIAATGGGYDHEVDDRAPVPEVPSLPWTGERFIPSQGGPEIYYEHAHRYVLARGLLTGAAVVDLASGEGYGAAWLAEVAESVIGIDIDEASVAHSRAQYRRHANLVFALGDIQSLPLASSSVDAVTCFEAVEHVENPRAVVEEVVRILRPGGLLLVSTPNKAVYADQRDYNNEFHIHEFYLPDLELLLGEYFAERELVGQRVVAGSLTWRLEDSTAGVHSKDDVGVLVAPGFHESGTTERPTMVEPMYVLGACRLAGTPRIQGSLSAASVLVDSEELLLDRYCRCETNSEGLGSRLRDQEAQLGRARAQLAAYEEQANLLRRRIRELDEQAATPSSGRPILMKAESESLQAALVAQQALAARLSGDLVAANEVNLRLLVDMRALQGGLARMQLEEPARVLPSSRLSPQPSRPAARLPQLPPRLRAAARRARCLVPWL